MAMANACLIKYELDINVYNFENWLFLLVGSLKKWFAQSTAGKQENS